MTVNEWTYMKHARQKHFDAQGDTQNRGVILTILFLLTIILAVYPTSKGMLFYCFRNAD